MDIIVGASIGAVQVVIGHPLDTAKTLLQNGQSWSKLSARQFYRGWTWPIAASVVFNAVAFPVYHRALQEVPSPYAAGLVSGFAVAPIEYGFGAGKIRQQTQTHIPWHGRGFVMATVRTTLAMSVYFGVYEDLKSTVGPFLAGACAGVANWTLTYPFDLISTRQIASRLTIREACALGQWSKGYWPCVARAILVNSVSFKMYDMCYTHHRSTI